MSRSALTGVFGTGLALVLAACSSDDPGSPRPVTSGATPPSVPSGAASPSAPPNVETPALASNESRGLQFDSLGHVIVPDAGPPPAPTPLRPDGPVPGEPFGREDSAGVTIEAIFRPRKLVAATKGPEVSGEGLQKAAKLAALTSTVDLVTAGRMRWVFTSRALPFTYMTEIRARYPSLGQIVIWPNEPKYRVLIPGALRTALNEGRVDVMPLTAGTRSTVVPVPPPPAKRLGEKTRVVVLESALGKIRLELAKSVDAGAGGPLLCRSLVELAGIDPATPECAIDELPLFAAIEFKGGDGIDFEATSLTVRTDISPSDAAFPPPSVEFQDKGLPISPAGVFLTKDEVGAIRTKPVDVKVDNRPGTPGEGLVLENGKDQPLYYFLDGVPIASVPAMGSRYVLGMPKGHYAGQWRSFLGDMVDAPEAIDAPSKVMNVKPHEETDAGPTP